MIELAGDRMRISESADGSATITFDAVGTGRTCGDCQLCCKLLPLTPLNKPANTRCTHQRHAKGCMIYPDRPMACKTWACRWLADADTAGMPRPDRCHYVIDLVWDHIEAQEADGQTHKWPAIQIWVDPAFRNAYRAPELRTYLAGLAERYHAVAIIRWGTGADSIILIAPSLSGTGEWLEKAGIVVPRETFTSPLSLGDVR